MPVGFRRQTQEVLLCWLRTPLLPSHVVVVVLRHLFDAEAAQAAAWEASGRPAETQHSGGSQLLQDEIERLEREARVEEEYEKHNDSLLAELTSAMRDAGTEIT